MGGLRVTGVEAGEGKVLLRLDTLDPGAYALDPVTVRFLFPGGESREIRSGALVVEVKSLLTPDASDIRDIKGPLAAPASRWPVGLVIAVLVLLTGGGLWALVGAFSRRRKKTEEAISLPPHAAALYAIDRLLDLDLVGKGRVKEFYFRLSQIVRRYIEARFGLKAPERTTEEFLLEMAVTDLLARDHKRFLKKFLTHCDRVKFARYRPDPEEVDGAVSSGRTFIRETTPEEEGEEEREEIGGTILVNP